ncbi:ImmA/IrrE family metallo-endopeptidase [Microbacterium testaceum]|uniref:ImmA/IrrE family metallo-endopeptidase n=1 Tax=Microbacterium enclense TaxID=993073 RepID=UPI0012B91E86|nr:ImmA/IrrE family metallo-endopeptidase [Microbacterium testaceum]
MKKLLSLAAHLGVTVHVAHLPEPFRGFYDHERRRVVYDFRLTPIERACVLAHELGHAFYGHQGRDDPDAEAAADAFAAAALVDPTRFAELESLGLSDEALAEELGVTMKLLRVFVTNHLTRVRGVTYTRPRLGRGHYQHALRWAS